MPKATLDDLKAIGLDAQSLGEEDDTFDVYLQQLLTAQSGLLLGRIGAAAYNDTTSPMKEFVAKAETALCAVEMWKRRIAKKLSHAAAAAEPISSFHEDRAKKDWEEEAETMISRINPSGGFSSGTVQSRC